MALNDSEQFATELAAQRSRLGILVATLANLTDRSEPEIRGMIDGGLLSLGRRDLVAVPWPYDE